MMTLDDELLEPQQTWVVPKAGLEPAQPLGHCPLKTALKLPGPHNCGVSTDYSCIISHYNAKTARRTRETRPEFLEDIKWSTVAVIWSAGWLFLYIMENS